MALLLWDSPIKIDNTYDTFCIIHSHYTESFWISVKGHCMVKETIAEEGQESEISFNEPLALTKSSLSSVLLVVPVLKWSPAWRPPLL
jgi:hypothetical protein